MVSSTFHVPLIFILLCGFALLSDFAADGKKNKDTTLTVAKLNRELRREYKSFFVYHLVSMLSIASYGDRLYNITDEDISGECLKTIKAAYTMTMQLPIGKEMDSLVDDAVTDAMPDIETNKESKKHPFEFVCKKLEKAFAQKPTLSAAFEKAQKNLMKGFTEGGRPPYSQELFTKYSTLAMFVLRKLTIPDMARLVANEDFQNQMEEEDAYSTRTHLFVKSIVAVAKKEKFGQSIQSMYEKSLDEIIPQITSNVKIDTLLLEDQQTFWFLPKLLSIFYKNLTKDAALKKEVDDAAAEVVGKYANKEDLDFSKI